MPVTSVTYFTGGEEEPGRPEKLALDLPPDIRVERIGAGSRRSPRCSRAARSTRSTPRACHRSFVKGDGKVRRLFENYRRGREASTFARPASSRSCTRWRSGARCTRRIAGSRSRSSRHSAPRSSETYSDLYADGGAQDDAALADRARRGGAARDGRRISGPTASSPTGRRSTTFLRYHHEQGLSKRLLQPEELFAPRDAGVVPDLTDYEPSNPERSGRRKCQSVARWNARPRRTSVASANGAPMSCAPIGNPCDENPAGSESAQAPR